MANDNFQKGGEKESEGLGLSAAISKTRQNREDRISTAIYSGAKEWIDDLDLFRIVLEVVNEGESISTVPFTKIDRKNPDKPWIDWQHHGAIKSDNITTGQIYEKMCQMMDDEGVEIWITDHADELAFNIV